MRTLALVCAAIVAALACSDVVAVAARDRSAPRAYLHVVPRLGAEEAMTYDNLVYEGNNVAMRGERDESGCFADGEAIARRWRAMAQRVRGVFVLRDAMFSQQDHPFEQAPYVPTLPPSWVTIAVAATRRSEPLPTVAVPLPSDDAAWQGFQVAQAFGPFPVSDRLVAAATTSSTELPERRRAGYARLTLLALSEHVNQMRSVTANGSAAVARMGAERIASSDASYFGAARSHIIPITVENPNPHEIEDEAKGFVVYGSEIADDVVREATNAVLSARLARGPIALERYDISRPRERERLRALLAALVPKGTTGADVWVWIHAGLDARGIHGPDPLPYVAALMRALRADGRIAMARVRLLPKPHVTLRGESARETLDRESARARALGVSLSINLRPSSLARLLSPPAPR